MVERVLCKHEVVGSNPSGSTIKTRSKEQGFQALGVGASARVALGSRGSGDDIVNGRVSPALKQRWQEEL